MLFSGTSLLVIRNRLFSKTGRVVVRNKVHELHSKYLLRAFLLRSL
jgi:hypothetical protein